jgi:hypothetical protein
MTFVSLDKLTRFVFFSLFFLASVFQAKSQITRVLWIGNSYTAYNNLPLLFRDLALSAGDSVYVEANTPGGVTLQGHTTNAITLEKIASPGWDYVVLQAQSQEPSFPPSQVNTQTLPYAVKLDSLIHVSNPCATTVFYMTWGRKYGDPQNCAGYPPLCTFEGMSARLRWGYKTMADSTNAIIAPVGNAWKSAWYADSTLNLWNADLSHPSIYGSYLAACTFYRTIFEKPSFGLSYTSTLNANQAGFLQQHADAAVSDSLLTWNIGRFEPQAGFNFDAVAIQVNFEQTSLNANQFYWSFGDGETSSEANPQHIFPGEGIYPVRLIVSDGCSSDTISQSVSIITAGNLETEYQSWRIFPNPASKEVMIQAAEMTKFNITVYASNGQIVKAFDEEGQLIKLDFSDLPTGVYQILCSSESERRIFRIMKD